MSAVCFILPALRAKNDYVLMRSFACKSTAEPFLAPAHKYVLKRFLNFILQSVAFALKNSVAIAYFALLTLSPKAMALV